MPVDTMIYDELCLAIANYALVEGFLRYDHMWCKPFRSISTAVYYSTSTGTMPTYSVVLLYLLPRLPTRGGKYPKKGA